MKRILSSSLIMLLALSASAAPRTTAQKKAAALSALNRIGNNGTRRIKAAGTAELQTLESADAYTVLGYKNGGFAIIANDDRNEAVVGYSASTFTRLPDGMRWYLNALGEVLAAGGAAPRYTFMPKLEQAQGVAPMLDCEWGQSAPFSNLTPHNYPTGCVATAMAQIMYYHKYPTSGTGKFLDVNTRKQIDISKSTYDYASMLPSYNGTYTNAQATAVATLMYHCGLTVNMDYNADGSGAVLSDARSAVIDNFFYNANANSHFRYIHNIDEWMDLVYEELDNKRPILYGGQDANGTGGHAFVFDGYNSDGLVHVNWGWDGDCNGYYDISLLNPSDNMGNKYQYSQGQAMLTGMGLPSDNVARYSEIFTQTPLSLTLSGTTISMNGDFVIYNHNYYDFSGAWYLMLVGVDNDYVSPLGGYSFAQNAMPGIDDKGNIMGSRFSNIKSPLPDDMPDGTYIIFNAVQDAGYDYFNPVAAADGVNQYYTLVKKGGNLTLTRGVVTGISSVTAAAKKADGAVYTLDGHKLSGTLDAQPAGIYITGGKKVVK